MHNFSITSEEADLFFSDMFKNIIPADNSVNIDDSMNLRQSQNYTVGLSGFIESRKRAENWKNKWYEDTISENINILQDYIELCLKNNVRPILVIYPCTSLYRKWFPKRMLNHFYYIISNMQKKYNIMILDCYASDKFDDIIDFRDSDHLNLSGAAKMTAIINEIL